MRWPFLSTVSRSNWNFERWFFAERGKLETLRKNPRSKDENQQQTQLKCDIGSWNQTWATEEGGECSRHCAIPAPLKSFLALQLFSLFHDLNVWLRGETVGRN